MTEEQQVENFGDENVWGVVGDVFEEAMYYDIPMPVVIAIGVLSLAFYIVNKRAKK